MATRTGLQPGDMVKIMEGLFSSTAGPVDTVGDESIVTLITDMGRELRTIIPRRSSIGIHLRHQGKFYPEPS